MGDRIGIWQLPVDRSENVFPIARTAALASIGSHETLRCGSELGFRDRCRDQSIDEDKE